MSDWHSPGSNGTGSVKLVSGGERRGRADDLGVDTQPEGPSWARCRRRVTGYPAEITAHCVWLYHNVLDILVQPRRNAKAAKRFFRKLLNRQCRVPRVLVTDKLRSYQVAHRAVMPSVEHRQSRYLNNRAENSHQPTRHRERAMKRFRTPGAAQRFLAVFSVISPHFRPRRHRLTADDYRIEMADRFATWNDITRSSQAA